MNAEKTYLVRQNDSSERVYRLYELTWLWRTAALPHDSVYRSDDGQWRPVRELVEPLLRKSPEALSRIDALRSGEVKRTHRWTGGLAIGVSLAAAVVLMLKARPYYAAWMAKRISAREALHRERNARTEDFIQSNAVVLGMTPEEVRRAIGAPRAVQATGDASLERWFYRRQIVVFQDGKVIGVEVRP